MLVAAAEQPQQQSNHSNNTSLKSALAHMQQQKTAQNDLINHLNQAKQDVTWQKHNFDLAADDMTSIDNTPVVGHLNSMKSAVERQILGAVNKVNLLISE